MELFGIIPQGGRRFILEYDGYEPMALRKMKEIGAEIRKKWSVHHIGIVHRLGRLEIGEASVVIAITSAHRKIAFEACQHAIDTLKKIVPIWKKEFFEDGEVWVEGEYSKPLFPPDDIFHLNSGFLKKETQPHSCPSIL